MYFSNITNQELSYFHGIQIPNFTITLTDALTSQLFKVETVISDSIYKIFPLFYTGEITSNNPNDRVLENKCVICQRTDKETYLTFISDENEEIRDYENFTTYYDIGDTLTTAQFNSVVSLLRQNTVNNDSIRIGSDYTGEYGEYEFDIEGTTIVDTGIVITDETLENGIKVKLVNPVFHYSTYTLQLQVLHYTDVNVMDDDNEDFKVIEALNVELTDNEWVDVDLSELEEGYIILLDSNVSITHDKTEIHGLFGLNIDVDPTLIQTSDKAEITSTLLDYDGTPLTLGTLSGKTIYFFEELNPTLDINVNPTVIKVDDKATIQSQVVDEDGSLPNGLKVYFYEAIEEHGDPEVTSISLSNTNDVLSYYNSDSTVLTATVLDQYGQPMENESVTFKNGDTVLDTVTTDSSGEAEYTYTSTGAGDVTLTAECMLLQETYDIEDCLLYDPCTSNANASAWTIPTGVTSTYNSDGWKITANAYKQIKLTDKLTSDCSVEFTLSDYSTPSGNNPSVIIYAYTNGETTPNQSIIQNKTSTATTILDTAISNHPLVKGGKYRVEYTTSNLKVYEEDTLLDSKSNSIGFPTRFEFHMGANSRYAVYKDIKVKPL